MKNRAAKLFEIFMILITIILLISSVLAFAGRFFDGGILYLFNLSIPVILASGLFVFVYWLFKLCIAKSILSLCIILLHINILPALFQKGNDKRIIKNGSINICTYNIHGFRQSNPVFISKDIKYFCKSNKIDILCLQEFKYDKALKNDSTIKELLGFKYLYKAIKNNYGLLTLSNYKITKAKIMNYGHRNNFCLWCDIVINKDTVRVFNVHLMSTSINYYTYYVLKDGITNAGSENKRIKYTLRNITYNHHLRLLQTYKILSEIESTPYMHIICGDFNSTPFSRIYKLIAKKSKDGFKEGGSGYEYTYSYPKRIIRTDYIFTSHEIKCNKYNSFNLDLSDHYPVVSNLIIE